MGIEVQSKYELRRQEAIDNQIALAKKLILEWSDSDGKYFEARRIPDGPSRCEHSGGNR